MIDRTFYKVYLPDGKKICLWFMGHHLEKIFDAYNVKYEIVKGKK